MGTSKEIKEKHLNKSKEMLDVQICQVRYDSPLKVQRLCLSGAAKIQQFLPAPGCFFPPGRNLLKYTKVAMGWFQSHSVFSSFWWFQVKNYECQDHHSKDGSRSVT